MSDVPIDPETLQMLQYMMGQGQYADLNLPVFDQGGVDLMMGMIPTANPSGSPLTASTQANLVGDWSNLLFDQALMGMSGAQGFSPEAFDDTITYEAVDDPGVLSVMRYLSNDPDLLTSYLNGVPVDQRPIAQPQSSFEGMIASAIASGKSTQEAIAMMRQLVETQPDSPEAQALLLQMPEYPPSADNPEGGPDWRWAFDEAAKIEDDFTKVPMVGAQAAVTDADGNVIKPAGEIIVSLDDAGNPILMRKITEPSELAQKYADLGLTPPGVQYTPEDFMTPEQIQERVNYEAMGPELELIKQQWLASRPPEMGAEQLRRQGGPPAAPTDPNMEWTPARDSDIVPGGIDQANAQAADLITGGLTRGIAEAGGYLARPDEWLADASRLPAAAGDVLARGAGGVWNSLTGIFGGADQEGGTQPQPEGQPADIPSGLDLLHGGGGLGPFGYSQGLQLNPMQLMMAELLRNAFPQQEEPPPGTTIPEAPPEPAGPPPTVSMAPDTGTTSSTAPPPSTTTTTTTTLPPAPTTSVNMPSAYELFRPFGVQQWELQGEEPPDTPDAASQSMLDYLLRDTSGAAPTTTPNGMPVEWWQRMMGDVPNDQGVGPPPAPTPTSPPQSEAAPQDVENELYNRLLGDVPNDMTWTPEQDQALRDELARIFPGGTGVLTPENMGTVPPEPEPPRGDVWWGTLGMNEPPPTTTTTTVPPVTPIDIRPEDLVSPLPENEPPPRDLTPLNYAYGPTYGGMEGPNPPYEYGPTTGGMGPETPGYEWGPSLVNYMLEQMAQSQTRPVRHPEAPYGGEDYEQMLTDQQGRIRTGVGPPPSEEVMSDEYRRRHLHDNAPAGYPSRPGSGPGILLTGQSQRRAYDNAFAEWDRATDEYQRQKMAAHNYATGQALGQAMRMQAQGVTPYQQQVMARRLALSGMGMPTGYLPGY